MKCQIIQESLITQDFEDIIKLYPYDLLDKKPGFYISVDGKEKNGRDFIFMVSNPIFYSDSIRRIYLLLVSRQTGSLTGEFYVIRKIYKFYKESDPKDYSKLKMISKEARSCFVKFVNSIPDNLNLDQIENLIQSQKQWKIAL